MVDVNPTVARLASPSSASDDVERSADARGFGKRPANSDGDETGRERGRLEERRDDEKKGASQPTRRKSRKRGVVTRRTATATAAAVPKRKRRKKKAPAVSDLDLHATKRPEGGGGGGGGRSSDDAESNRGATDLHLEPDPTAVVENDDAAPEEEEEEEEEERAAETEDEAEELLRIKSLNPVYRAVSFCTDLARVEMHERTATFSSSSSGSSNSVSCSLATAVGEEPRLLAYVCETFLFLDEACRFATTCVAYHLCARDYMRSVAAHCLPRIDVVCDPQKSCAHPTTRKPADQVAHGQGLAAPHPFSAPPLPPLPPPPLSSPSFSARRRPCKCVANLIVPVFVPHEDRDAPYSFAGSAPPTSLSSSASSVSPLSLTYTSPPPPPPPIASSDTVATPSFCPCRTQQPLGLAQPNRFRAVICRIASLPKKPKPAPLTYAMRLEALLGRRSRASSKAASATAADAERYRTVPNDGASPHQQFLRVLELVRRNMREAGTLRAHETRERERERKRVGTPDGVDYYYYYYESKVLERADAAGCGDTVSRIVGYPGFRNWLRRSGLFASVFSACWQSSTARAEWFDRLVAHRANRRQ